jgi:hypothetical protein
MKKYFMLFNACSGIPKGRNVNNPMQAEGAAWGAHVSRCLGMLLLAALLGFGGCKKEAGNDPDNPTQPPTTLCTQCCWDGAAATWVDCYVTTNAYPFDNDTTNTYVVWSGTGDTYYDGARSDRDGRANTAAISSTGKSAVQLCKDLGTGWYLPAYEELVNMSTGYETSPLNGLSGADILKGNTWDVWSSTELAENGGRESYWGEFAMTYAVTVNSYGTRTGAKRTGYDVRCAWRK